MSVVHQSAQLTVGSLFSGIGGFDLGLERTGGFRTAWFCEQDPYCQRVLAKHWPDTPIHPDITELHDPTPVDVLCGGFPCQDLSYAGAGAGLSGARSGLWSEYARLIRELRPRYVLVENVSALLARGLGTVLGDLAALGYDAEWDCIPASAVGAPHRRDRIWLVAYPQSPRLEGSGLRGRPAIGGAALADTDASSGYGARGAAVEIHGPSEIERPGRRGSAPRDVGDPEGNGRGQGRPGRPDSAGAGQREPVRALQDADGSALQPWRVGGRAAQAGGPEWWSAEPPVGRVAHGVPDRLDQLAALGNALVPQIAEWIGHRVLAYEAEIGALNVAA